MADLPNETLASIFNLQPRLFQIINQAKAAEFNLFQQYGETERSLPDLEQLNNAAERARISYNRLYQLLLLIAESQPVASYATMNLLYQSIEQALATVPAAEATVEEIKRDWNLL